MVQGRRVGPDLHSSAGPPGPVEPLEELAQDAARRLRAASLVFAGLWVISLAVNHLIAPWLGLPPNQVLPWPPVADAVALACIALSFLVYRIAPRAAARGKTLLHVALAYEVALALGVALINQWQPQVLAGRLSWLCVLILVFPTIVPGPPRKVLAASLLVASMDPLALLLAWGRGQTLPALGLLTWAYLPNYICAALAILPARIIEHLGRKVRRAREMGSYRLVELIGRGGMGEVWKAEHRLLARPAAVKLIRAERLLDPDDTVAEGRFRLEAEAAASLRSPHTIQLYDFGMTRDRELYYVMELLDGTDLEALVARHGPQPPARVAHIACQACRSLAEAHAAGLVHRDIKPANLHLCRLGLEYDFVKVLDFGLVKGLDRPGPEALGLTAPESATGTPAYMPPELACGGPVDGRTDLYALGCVCYFLLTGRLVFEGETPVQVIAQHLHAEPVPPSVRVGRPMPSRLEDTVMHCLAKNPTGRPGSAGELAALLTACDAGTWTQEDARRWWEANAAALRTGDPSAQDTLGLLDPTTVSPVHASSRSSASP